MRHPSCTAMGCCDTEERPEACRTEPDFDPIGAEIDAFDQGSQQRALAWRGQLGPAVPEFSGSRHEPALCYRICKPCCIVNAAWIEEPLAHAAIHELLDPDGWDAQPGGALGLIFGDQRFTSLGFALIGTYQWLIA